MAAAVAFPSSGVPISLRNRLDRRWAAMKTERSSFDAHIRDIADYMRPRRTRFTQSKVNKGDRRDTNIVDNTPMIASRVCTSGMSGGLASPARPWFKYETDDMALMQVGAVKEWLNLLEALVRRIFHVSNVYNILPTLCDELSLFGTAASIVDDHFDRVIHLNALTWGEYCLGIAEDGSVDTLYRECRMSVWQVVRKFVRQANGEMDWNRASLTVKSLYDSGNYDSWVDVMHAIEPNPDFDPEKMSPLTMAWRSVYWEPATSSGPDGNKLLRRSGYRENPIIAPRWEVIGNDVYGQSCPGMNALGDARQLQIQQKRKGEAIEKTVRPPTQGPASTANRFVGTLPGYHNVVATAANGGDGIRPVYQINPNIAELVNDIEDTRERIRQAFFVRDFLPISAMQGVQPKNQFELSERKAEGLLVLGPTVERLNNEMLNPLHERVISRIYEVSEPFWAVGEQGMLPPPPKELQGRPINILYTGTLAQVQKGVAISGVEQYANFAAGLIGAGFKDAALKFDAEQAMDEYADMLGLPVSIVRSDEMVVAMKQAMAEQEAAARMAQAAPAIRDIAEAGKAASETNIGGGVGALEAMLGNAGQ